jgi:hypothetical protein
MEYKHVEHPKEKSVHFACINPKVMKDVLRDLSARGLHPTLDLRSNFAKVYNYD